MMKITCAAEPDDSDMNQVHDGSVYEPAPTPLWRFDMSLIERVKEIASRFQGGPMEVTLIEAAAELERFEAENAALTTRSKVDREDSELHIQRAYKAEAENAALRVFQVKQMSEIVQFKAENAALKAELGGLPEAQAEMLADCKKLTAENAALKADTYKLPEPADFDYSASTAMRIDYFTTYQMREAHAAGRKEALEDAERLDWLDKECSEDQGRRICCLPGGLRLAIDATMKETK